ncbi:hypothetical protein BHE74_00014214 [Ensete ventricosum]|nr:hypothetical protein BHE74_00014214 [Ensete ventricosum]
MGRTWPAFDKTKRRAAYSKAPRRITCPPRAFSPTGSEFVDARAMSASITTSILVALRPHNLSSYLWGFSSNRW